jgi:2-methylisocitrate lyase-like PEP mutase family enzyme
MAKIVALTIESNIPSRNFFTTRTALDRAGYRADIMRPVGRRASTGSAAAPLRTRATTAALQRAPEEDRLASQAATATTRLRALLQQDGMVVAPGAYDCIGARVIEQAGFSAVYMTGAGTAATLGYPDYGLVTMTEMAENAGRLAAAVKVPVIADADTGYGNELNVTRTVREYQKRGVAGLHIEDQGFPKKCGHLDDKVVIPRDDYLAKIRAAAAARTDPDFLLIARTDARAVIGFEEAVARMNAALAAGADMAFLEAPQTAAEVEAVPKLVKGPCLLNVVSAARRRCSTWPMPSGSASSWRYCRASCSRPPWPRSTWPSPRSRRSVAIPDMKISLKEKFRRVGAEEWDALRERFRTPSAGEARRTKTAAE